MSLNEWFEKGLPSEEYMDGMQAHKENSASILDRFNVKQEDREFFNSINEKGLRAIALTEDWCGDAMMNVPILLKIAEAANIDVRMVLRDSNLELMDQYLTNGKARSIPIFIFIDQNGNEKAVWGPRAPKVQEFVTEMRSDLPSKEDESFAEKQKDVYAKMMKSYTEDTNLWDEVYNSIKEKLKTV